MTKSKMANLYSPEVRARAVRMVFEHQGSYETQAGAIAAIARKIGCIPQTLRDWVKQTEKDSGMRDGVTELSLKVDGAVKSGFWVLVARNFNFTDGDNALFFGVIAGE